MINKRAVITSDEDDKVWSPEDLFKGGTRGSWVSEGVRRDFPETYKEIALEKDDQYYIKKYQEALGSIVEGSEWIDNEGEVFIVISNTEEYGVNFKNMIAGYTSSQSESSFLHTFKRNY